MQVLDGGIAYIAEGSHEPFIHRCLEGQRVAVAVEDATVSFLWQPSDRGVNIKVGIKASVHVVLTFGILYLHFEIRPVGLRADGEVELLHIGQLVDGRCVAVHIHLYIVGHARAREVDNLVALCALVVGQGIDEAIDNVALAVLHRDA